MSGPRFSVAAAIILALGAGVLGIWWWVDGSLSRPTLQGNPVADTASAVSTEPAATRPVPASTAADADASVEPVGTSPSEAGSGVSAPPSVAAVEPFPVEGSAESSALTATAMSSASAAGVEPPNLYPTSTSDHLQSVGQRIRTIGDALALEPERTRALTSVLAQHVRAERLLWEEAQLFGETEIEPEKLAELDELTLDTIRSDPELGPGVAEVVNLLFDPLVRDPGAPPDPNPPPPMSVMELRSLLDQ